MNRKGDMNPLSHLGTTVVVLIVIAVSVGVLWSQTKNSTSQIDQFRSCGGLMGSLGGTQGQCMAKETCTGPAGSGYYYQKIGEGKTWCPDDPKLVCCLKIPDSDNPPSASQIAAAKPYTCPVNSGVCANEIGTYLWSGEGLPGKCVYEVSNTVRGVCWKCPPGNEWRRASDGTSIVCNRGSSDLPTCGPDSEPECSKKGGVFLPDYEYSSNTLIRQCVYKNKDSAGRPVCWPCNPTQANCGAGIAADVVCADGNECGKARGIYVFDYKSTSQNSERACVYEYLNPQDKGICWSCDVNRLLCGRTPDVRRCSTTASEKECRNSDGVSAGNYTPLPGKSACVYSRVDNQGNGICRRCDKVGCGVA